jgi:N-formylglutamate amidohydrolase
MPFASFNLPVPNLVVATAVHNGHELRSELADLIELDEPTRLREEDPHTGALAARFESSVIVHRSRFEVDLNRERDIAVYRNPDDAWGLDLWRQPLPDHQVSESVALYDTFYADLANALDRLVAERGGFVLFDIHSYNHRRSGPEADPDPPEENPVVNLGTGSLPGRWQPVSEAFMKQIREQTLDELPLDVRENVRFQGRQVARWVHETYTETGCALAIELKKVYMDEWTGKVYPDKLRRLGDALVSTIDEVERAWARA